MSSILLLLCACSVIEVFKGNSSVTKKKLNIISALVYVSVRLKRDFLNSLSSVLYTGNASFEL